MTDRRNPNCFENDLFQCCFSFYQRREIDCHGIRSILRTVRDFLLSGEQEKTECVFRNENGVSLGGSVSIVTML